MPLRLIFRQSVHERVILASGGQSLLAEKSMEYRIAPQRQLPVMASGLCLAGCVELDISTVTGFRSWIVTEEIEEIVNGIVTVLKQKIILLRLLMKIIKVGEI
jgi:hypothetical protein